MKIKFYLIIICLTIFGCKSKEKPVYIERIGLLTPGGGGTPTLEVYVDKEDRQYDIYYLHFYEVYENYEGWGPGNYDTHPFGKNVKVIGEDNSRWTDLWYGRKRYDLHILVKSMEVIE